MGIQSLLLWSLSSQPERLWASPRYQDLQGAVVESLCSLKSQEDWTGNQIKRAVESRGLGTVSQRHPNEAQFRAWGGDWKEGCDPEILLVLFLQLLRTGLQGYLLVLDTKFRCLFDLEQKPHLIILKAGEARSRATYPMLIPFSLFKVLGREFQAARLLVSALTTWATLPVLNHAHPFLFSFSSSWCV
jgi:hypothetical protein